MAGLKVKFIERRGFPELTPGKIYVVVSVERGWYRIVTDWHEDYLYPPELFESVA